MIFFILFSLVFPCLKKVTRVYESAAVKNSQFMAKDMQSSSKLIHLVISLRCAATSIVEGGCGERRADIRSANIARLMVGLIIISCDERGYFQRNLNKLISGNNYLYIVSPGNIIAALSKQENPVGQSPF